MGAHLGFAVAKAPRITGCSLCLKRDLPRQHIAYHCRFLECYGLPACIECVKGSDVETTDTVEGYARATPEHDMARPYGVEGELATAFLLRCEKTLWTLNFDGGYTSDDGAAVHAAVDEMLTKVIKSNIRRPDAPTLSLSEARTIRTDGTRSYGGLK